MPFLRGEVTDNSDPMKRGRVRVKVWGVHDDDDDDLPWAEVMGDTADPLHNGSGTRPKEMPVGCTVWVEFEHGDINCPIVCGVFVGHNTDSMAMAFPFNSDYMMAKPEKGGGGLFGTLGSMIGGAIGGPLGAEIGGMIGGMIGDEIGGLIGGSGGGGDGEDGEDSASSGASSGVVGGDEPWYVKNGILYMGSWSRSVSYPGQETYGPLIKAKATAAGINPNYMMAMANIESGFVATAQNATYGGLFQINKKDFPSWKDPTVNTLQAIKNYKTNEAYWKKVNPGDPFTAGKAYLMHQQGIAGGPALYGGGSRKAVDILKKWHDNPASIITANGGNVNMTGPEYARMWINKADALAAYYAGQTSGGESSTGSSGGGTGDASSGPTDTPTANARKAAAYVVSHALPRSSGYCATYVNNGIRKGISPSWNINGDGWTVAANLLKGHPTKFKEVPYNASYVPIIGDVMSMPAGDPVNKARQAAKYSYPLPGHVAMFTEKGWVSDFIQGTKYGNTGAANSNYYSGIKSGSNWVKIARFIA